MIFILGAFTASFLLIQIEFSLSLLPVLLAPISEDMRVVAEVLILMLLAIFVVGHLRATWLVCQEISKLMEEMEQKENQNRNKIWVGALWRLKMEWISIKGVIEFKK